MNECISTTSQTCYYETCHLAIICRFQRSTTTATFPSAFDQTRINYCNSLLFCSTYNVTSHLQCIRKYAARIILHIPKSANITTHIKSLHWFPVKLRSTYKIACLCYHCHSTSPSYITDILHKKPSHSHNRLSSLHTMHTARQHLVITHLFLPLLLYSK